MLLSLFLAASVGAVTVPPDDQGRGFTCHHPNGQVWEFNVYTKQEVWTQRNFVPRKVYGVLDNAVVLLSERRSADDWMFMSLDRRTLKVDVYGKSAARGLFNATWTCTMGAVIDFDPPNKF